MPLTADRAKPAVPFAGIYRLIDFALSNVVNSGYLQVVVLTQYKSHSLDRHVTQTWRMSTMLGNYVAPVPAQQRVGKHWYLGSGDAIFQSLNLLRDEQPDIVVVVGRRPRLPDGLLADGRPAPRERRGVHGGRDPAADLAGRPVRRHRRRARARRPGSGSSSRSRPTPTGLPDSPDEVLASMGNYVFDADALVEAVTRDATTDGSKHDMGGDIVPCVRPPRAGRRLRLQGQRGAGLDRPRPRLLARRRDAGVLLRRAHGRRLAAAGVQPLQLRVADLHLLRPAAAGQARAGRRRHPGAGRRGGALARASSSAAARCSGRCSRRRSAIGPGRTWRARC